MNDAMTIEFTLHAMWLVLILSLPPILVASAIGIIVSLIQAVTQVQEQTISFAVKLVAVVVTLVLTSRWIGGEIYQFSLKLFDMFPHLVK